MKRSLLLLIITLFLVQCAAYKQLKPKPEVKAAEDGYIELKNDKKDFELKKDKKYFIIFPGPRKENFYLVLDLTNKELINSYLTETFDDGKGRIVEIKDESTEPDHQSVFSLDKSVQKFYWVIDLVKQDLILNLKYRYVPKWRFRFENKAASFKETLSENRVDPGPYQNLGGSVTFDTFDVVSEAAQVATKTENLHNLKKKLKDIEDIFPPDIKNSNDPAYQDYVQLSLQLDEELSFQKQYATVLNLAKIDRQSRGKTETFLNQLSFFTDFYNHSEDYPLNAVSEISKILKRRLPECVAYYQTQFRKKGDVQPIQSKIDAIGALYKAARIPAGADFTRLSDFIHAFNKKANGLHSSRQKVDALMSEMRRTGQMPDNTYMSGMLTRLSKIQYRLPRAGGSALANFGSYTCVRLLNNKIAALQRRISNLLKEFRSADRLIPQINAYKSKNDYRAMRSLIRRNRDIQFLPDLYKNLDQLSLNSQKKKIVTALANQNWMAAEQALSALFSDNDFLHPQKMRPVKNQLVRTMEDSLYNKINRLSLNRARRFVKDHLMAVDSVESFYSNPVFRPVYEMTFSRNGSQAARQKMTRLSSQLKQIQTVDFPEAAIPRLYDSFTQNPNDRGVLKARAIVTHFRHYEGKNRKIRLRAAECDPWSSKWITKAKTYRRVFALPTTTNPGGKNEYVFRLNIRIPSEAKFPVYDLYIKLPKGIVSRARSEQWYKSITLNKKVIKNEGRYTITAPTAANNYECQVGPVRMVKDGDNVLEIHFIQPSFRVYSISVMAQKPIIKKH